ncbi:unnamed protein product [Nesidiocoris tenuis]|uniref:Uncharacterized protein n=1 Tax=Nesidiocoris tenuis TaxID=355587 RepID=A0A6H5HQ84_9HEMI|nr:unnamed protein product [Nesidiocoris tenuis]
MLSPQNSYRSEILETYEASDEIHHTSSTTKTSTMTTAAKLYGKGLDEYEEMDVDQLLSQLTAEEINMLVKDVDPDVSVKRLCFSKNKPPE